MKINMISELEDAIDEFDIAKVSKLLKQGINPDSNTNYPLLLDVINYLPNKNAFKILDLLLHYGANVNQYDEYYGKPLIYGCMSESYQVISLLLKYGANPIVQDEEGSSPLSISVYQNRLNIVSLLLKYGAKSDINKYHHFTVMSVLERAVRHCGLDILQLLLNNGADTTIPTEFDELIISVLDDNSNINTIKYTEEEYQQLQTLLNPKNPPYLKLEETEESKYIIYENKKRDDETYEIYLLTDKQKHPDKKYLYEDNKIDTFVYWCYKNELLNEPTMKVLDKYVSLVDVSQYNNLSDMLKQTLGEKLTTEYFNEAGKDFATSYLTVTHWWYSLHYDFNRLYQDKDNKLPRAVHCQEEFDTLMKLLDIRHEQFTSAKNFNSNQNKEELEALIEGREPPKRVVDLTFLEEEIEELNVLPNEQ